MVKRGLQKREKNQLSAKGLLELVRKAYEKVPCPPQKKLGKKQTITNTDALMSALAMFGLKAPSLLAFDNELDDPIVSNNLKTLYGVENVPSDTHMRTMLDQVNPDDLRGSFLAVFEAVQRGKLLEQYSFLDTYLAVVDGTKCFESNNVYCKDCCTKTSRDGKITYYHQMLAGVIVHPERRQVIPLCPELISQQDGTSKNDCEQRALQRFLAATKKEHPRLKLTIAADALSANAPAINSIIAHGYKFIINVKPGSNKTLFEFISGIELETIKCSLGPNTYTLRFINNIPLNDTKNAPLVNFLECKAFEIKGKEIVEKTFTWVTNHTITKDNVYLIMLGGRARWKIENETFNTLKNQGYQLEHNFGHGKKHLFSVFAYTMMLAFLIDQIQEIACGLFKAALDVGISRKALWSKIRNYFYCYYIKSWSDLFTAIITRFAASMDIYDDMASTPDTS